MRVTSEGRAQVGDCYRTPFGDWREVVAIVNAGDLIEAIGSQYVPAPHFQRESTAGRCMLFGDTSGREKRNIERRQQRQLREAEIVCK